MVPDPAAAAFRTAAGGRRPYISARTGPEGLLGSRPPPQVPRDWTALSVDGSHIDVDRHLPLRCHLVNLGGCAITYGKDFGCQLFSEPTLAVDGEDLYLRSPDGARGEILIAGPLLSALRTVREVERLRRVMAVSELPQPVRFRPGQHVIHHPVQVGQMPAGGQDCRQVFGWHVAVLSQSIQNAQHSPLGEVGLSGGRCHQVNHLRQTLTVGCGALAMTAADPTGAVSTISAMARGGLPGETGANDRT